MKNVPGVIREKFQRDPPALSGFISSEKGALSNDNKRRRREEADKLNWNRVTRATEKAKRELSCQKMYVDCKRPLTV